MKWSFWVQPNQIYEEEYPNGWSHDDVLRAANNRYGGKVTTVNPAPSGGTNYTSGAARTPSSSGGSGCGALIWLIGGVILLGMFGGGEDSEKPQGPVVSPEKPRVERVIEAQPEPQWKDYASPPPSYCVTENFEPC